MADEDSVQKVDDRIVCCTLQAKQRLKGEIEKAISHAKNSKKRTVEDKWFRRMWYISQARNRKSQLSEKPFDAENDNGDSFFWVNRQ